MTARHPLLVLASVALVGAGCFPVFNLQSSEAVGLTHQATLNDLVRRIPVQSRRREQALATLSSVHELAILHERKMRGEGLPPVHRAHFSANYSAVVGALIDDRITEEFGRELLQAHRILLDRSYRWNSLKEPDEETGDRLVTALKAMSAGLRENAESVSDIPDSVRTPMINGHQIWVEELLTWGCHCRHLSRGDLGHLGRLATKLERFERYYKRDGYVDRQERERLHERLIELQRELIAALER